MKRRRIHALVTVFMMSVSLQRPTYPVAKDDLDAKSWIPPTMIMRMILCSESISLSGITDCYHSWGMRVILQILW